MTERHEPTTWQIQASYKNGRNTRLAHVIFPLISWGTYDRYAAHRWVLKLISAQPKSGEEVATSLTNFEYMIEGARRKYQMSEIERRNYDAVYEAFAKWSAEASAVAA